MKTLKYALRYLFRAQSYTLINLLGLALSLACSILLLRYIHRELTVDTHCIDREQVYGAVIDMEGNHCVSSITEMQRDSVLIDPAYIERKAKVIVLEKDYVASAHSRFPARVIVADSVYFQLFRYPVIAGTLTLAEPASALLSEAFAQKLFGHENPIGKVLYYSNGKDVVVKGVLGEPINKTSMRFDVVLSSALSDNWERMAMEFYTFTPGTDVAKLNRNGSISRAVNPERYEVDPRNYTFSFIPIEQLYWDEEVHREEPVMFSWGSRSYLTILASVCALLLLTGILNFVNIYMVVMLRRGKEYGLKKVFGARGKTLYAQILTENVFLTGAALTMAWLIIEVTAGAAEKLFTFPFRYTPFDWQLSLAILVLLPLVTSIYPFFKYNYLPPITSIRSIGWGNRSVRARMAFLMVQYILTFLLVVFSLYSNNLLNVLLHTEPGFRTKDIILAHLIYESKDYASYTEESMKQRQQRVMQIDNALSSCPNIEKWDASYTSILMADYGTNYLNSRDEKEYLTVRFVYPSFFDLYGIKFVEGSLPQLDSNDFWGVVVANRAAMKALNYTSLEGAGLIEENKKRQNAGGKLTPIVAVVDDYYAGHLSVGVRPMIFQVSAGGMNGDLYQIACAPGKIKAVLDFLRKLELEVYGSEDFEYSLLEDDIEALYAKDRQISHLFSLFAGIAIVISCLGLFGVSLFDIRQRYREIAIRKVNGASFKDIYPMLCRKYLYAMAAAFVLAVPTAYYLIYRYTESFVVKAPVGVAIFIISLLVVLFISLATLWWQVRKATRINPSIIMKNE